MHSEARPVRTNGIDLTFDAFGDPARPSVLLIMGPGVQMIGRAFDFCTQLAARGHFVVRSDNRDVGLSTKFTSAACPTSARYAAKHAATHSV